MKTLRQIVLVLGALLGATGFAAEESQKTKTAAVAATAWSPPKEGDRPADYALVARLQMFDTMEGKKNIIEWDCYAYYDINTNEDKPANRRATWQVATFKRAPGLKRGLNLFDIGAQHRTAEVYLRPVKKDPKARVSLVKVWDDGKETELPEIDQPKPDPVTGFYLIKEALPTTNGELTHKYLLRSNDPELRLEAYYAKHPPTKSRQIEDGGPPCVPPVNEN
jgi:hypothetical protein